MNKFILSVLCLLCTMSVNAFSGQEVGRVTLQLPPGWVEVGSYESRLVINGGQNNAPIKNTLFQLPGTPSKPRALMLVSSTVGGTSMRLNLVSEKCPGSQGTLYANDYESSPRADRRECLVVNPRFAPTKFFKADSKVVDLMAEKGLEFCHSCYGVRTVVANSTGTQLRINLMADPKFFVLASSPADGNNANPSAALIAWGEALHSAVKNSVFSMDGVLNLPRMEFSN